MRTDSPDLVRDLIVKRTRLDSRKLLEYRKIECKLDVIPKAEGSCYVSIDDTKVIVGIKFDTMEPYEDTPDEGGLIVTLNYVPVVFQDMSQNKDIELSRVLDRSIRESKMLNLKDFCMKSNEQAIQVFIDSYIINYDGNLLDAMNLAAVKALKNTNMPKLENGKVEMTNNKINLNSEPIMITISNIRNNFLVDLNKAEEKAVDYSVAISYLGDNEICAMQKMGINGIKMKELDKILEIGKEKQKELRKFL
jgi:exosome complex component RRP42